MADQFTEIKTQGWGSRLMSSIQGVAVGFFFFIISFGVLFWNEGRVDISKVAKTAIEIPAVGKVTPKAEGQLVSVTGSFQSDQKLADNYLRAGDYILINRKAEIYSWEEEKEKSSSKNMGGSETTKTTYNYKKSWNSSPKDSTKFIHPEGHENPPMEIHSNYLKVDDGAIGDHKVLMSEITLPKGKKLSLNTNNVLQKDGLKFINQDFLYKGKGTLEHPTIGDVRVSYLTLSNPLNGATVFGKFNASNDSIVPFFDKNKNSLYRLFEGSREGAVAKMKQEHDMLTWVLRFFGCLFMWIGLMTMLSPISTFLDVVPILGSLGRGGFGIICFIITFVLSLTTIFISMIVHNLIALVVVLGLLIGSIIWWLNFQRQKSLEL
jgi:hypothetical protein